ncbi:2-hydroxyacid dehydrogenase [Actinoalloteichus hymeniacidonis]|uniref:Phosphoglycerate dehydrogenase-like oxidoreductase n=1 Tax=Actinoalloteichus hymeniacidonis TaxID=340345 RepID=A0AAC9MZF0_9PSEU|nr:2-hydroxyacid dehydrogenase [Actinoalloteichus hymeniacidonis]AOS65338.1 phosphoglycerate dehydrogenase-like oxidoreductase [Actinoalloteichus hymeniacidonis]MBB5906576.1 phosphoglycerate dehydrogenase-like enzyme [Actinoalloteichus hymeniacidonis]
MTTIVLVPNERGLQALAETPGVRAVQYAPGERFPAEAADAEVLVPGFLSAGAVEALGETMPRLRLIQLLSAGAEVWLPRTPPGVWLSTARGAHGGSTAEWALAAILAIYRELPTFEIRRQQRNWDQHGTDTLQGKRVLVLGAGDLGREMRRRLDASDAHTTFVARTPRDGVHGLADLPELLPQHDVVVVMVPLTAETTGLVDREFLAAMPDQAILVNAARGLVVDTDALVAELTAGRLRAALDVTDPEPLPADHPLWTVDGLLLTPHVGGSTQGGQDRAWAIAAHQIGLFAAGEEPTNLVAGEY